MHELPALRSDLLYGFVDKSVKSPRLHNPRLISNEDHDTMLVALREELRHAESFRFSVAFITNTALALLKEALLDFSGHGEIITSRYLDFNDPIVFRELLTLDNISVYIHDDPQAGFHAKGYVFDRGSNLELSAIIGSANLTDNALIRNREWNLRFSTARDGDIAFQIDDAIARQKQESVRLSAEWIKRYEQERRFIAPLATDRDGTLAKQTSSDAQSRRIEPNAMQAEALAELESVTRLGEKRAVIISATGTGKTILAALAVRRANPGRFLFLAHQNLIVEKAREEFAAVIDEPDDAFGLLTGKHKDQDKKFLFSSVQTLSQPHVLEQFAPDAFDYIVIDEVHRSGAQTYHRILDHFDPQFLLGLTATPERTDGFNIFELFDYNVPYEIRLDKALRENMLVPFHYYGVTDYIDAEGRTIDETTDLARLITPERVQHILTSLERYGYPEQVRGLMFCASQLEAIELSAALNSHSVHGHRLRTAALTGDTSEELRKQTISKLESGELDYILTVNIFNEGVDIPTVNQVVMLRNTESSIIFTQQLGRGLRKAPGKTHLRVIDFIGNYKNNFLIPVALFGDSSRSKDSLRQHLIDNAVDNSVSGVSSVNFDEIAQQRIFDSITATNLTERRKLKEDIQLLHDRLNAVPRLFDFARFDTVDPVVIANSGLGMSKKSGSDADAANNYWDLLHSQGFVDKGPTPTERQFLNLLSSELLTGIRPHELLLLDKLLREGPCTREEFAQYLQEKQTDDSGPIISSVERVLSLEFFDKNLTKKFGENPLIDLSAGSYTLSRVFYDCYKAEDSSTRDDGADSFARHVDDLVETGLFLSRERGYWKGHLRVGKRYTRREVCRLLNFEKNSTTIYGYKVDTFSQTIPVMITYHKSDDVNESVAYEDAFINPSTMQWFSKSNRTMESPDLRSIKSGEYPLHLFVKKDDAEGQGSFYLGTAKPNKFESSTMRNDAGKELAVVKMRLDLDSPVEQQLFDYLHADQTQQSPN